jgi:hypothetical protein
MTLYKSELASIEAYKKGELKGNYFIVETTGDIPYEIYSVGMGFAGEDKQHWSDPIAYAKELDYGIEICMSLEDSF